MNVHKYNLMWDNFQIKQMYHFACGLLDIWTMFCYRKCGHLTRLLCDKLAAEDFILGSHGFSIIIMSLIYSITI